jgi:hypothetical protein
MQPIMATAKKKFAAIRRKFDFSDRREKKVKLHKVLSLARARSQTLGRYCSINNVYASEIIIIFLYDNILYMHISKNILEEK